jgi:hypothetical protein
MVMLMLKFHEITNTIPSVERRETRARAVS